MTPDELRDDAVALFGRRGWISDLAACLKVDRSTVHRWMSGVAIPGPVEAAVKCWIRRLRETGERPNPD